jgi:hypothetical protein
MERKKKTKQEQIRALKFQIAELQQEYIVQLYFETMPEYDALYKYCYATSNMKISALYHDVDFWLRAVMQHMSQRRPGHGGEFTDSILVQLHDIKTQVGVDSYIDYIAAKLHKKLDIKKPRKKPVG